MGSIFTPIIPIAEPEFTNSCACRIPPLPALSPLVKGGEGWGEGGFTTRRTRLARLRTQRGKESDENSPLRQRFCTCDLYPY